MPVERPAARPIFVVGAARSGTTLTRLVLDSHPSIACGPETHFLIDLQGLVTRHWHRIELFGWDRARWIDHSREFYLDLVEGYAAAKGKPRWADKTPVYALHLPYVLEMFPDAQIVHLIRDPAAVAASWQQRWGTRKALEAPRSWVARITAARAAGGQLPADQYLELRFEKLVTDPETSFRQLFEFLGEPWDPAVLEYDRVEHDSSPRNRTVSSAARAAGGGPIDSRRATEHRLHPLVRLELARVTRPLARELGYLDR